ncbi:uncharacterized protein LOC119662649 [Teleopsis dalmanni]|uniref:uncharacterized protein LOC119662649 n=1 Tax=Teleopsis dalmanni TaxID=139649 RepID=UPI0018CE0DB3|nr:uncharacterized protein LOC119662649 [Teleopsis dalmanni]
MASQDINLMTDAQVLEMFNKCNFGTLLAPIINTVDESTVIIITMPSPEPELIEVYVYMRSELDNILLGHISCRQLDLDIFNRLRPQICPDAMVVNTDVWINSEAVTQWLATM